MYDDIAKYSQSSVYFRKGFGSVGANGIGHRRIIVHLTYEKFANAASVPFPRTPVLVPERLD